MAAADPPYTHDPWGYARYAEILLGVQWLIDRDQTDPDLFSLMDIVRSQGEGTTPWEWFFTQGDPYNPPSDIHCWADKSDPTQQNFMIHHGVNVMEAIKTGPAWYRVSGNDTDAANAMAALDFIDTYCCCVDSPQTGRGAAAAGT